MPRLGYEGPEIFPRVILFSLDSGASCFKKTEYVGDIGLQEAVPERQAFAFQQGSPVYEGFLGEFPGSWLPLSLACSVTSGRLLSLLSSVLESSGRCLEALLTLSLRPHTPFSLPIFSTIQVPKRLGEATERHFSEYPRILAAQGSPSSSLSFPFQLPFLGSF